MYTQKELLKFAGRLANSCQNILKSDVKTLSESIQLMEQELNEYDNAILDMFNDDK